jgi:hypothetical protein
MNTFLKIFLFPYFVIVAISFLVSHPKITWGSIEYFQEIKLFVYKTMPYRYIVSITMWLLIIKLFI